MKSMICDSELVQLLSGTDPIIKDYQLPGDCYTKDSPIQPSSVDLRLGAVMVPGPQKDVPAGTVNPMESYILPPGGTAIATTKEIFKLPNTVAAVVFPASRVSVQGILITNPGHVDPGFEGPLRFTLINMGKEPYALTTGSPFITAMFFTVSPAHKGWLERQGGVKADLPKIGDLNRLTPDFLEIDQRAINKANEVVKKATDAVREGEIRFRWWAGITTGVITLIGTLVSVILPGCIAREWKQPIADIRADVTVLKGQMDLKGEIATVKSQVDTKVLEDRIRKLEQALTGITNQTSTLHDARQASMNIGQPTANADSSAPQTSTNKP